MDQIMDYAYSAVDGGWVPDSVLRPVIRQLCKKRLREIDGASVATNHANKMAFIDALSAPTAPLAIHQDLANKQHYEVPTSFLSLCLGPRMKYSSCYYPSLAIIPSSIKNDKEKIQEMGGQFPTKPIPSAGHPSPSKAIPESLEEAEIAMLSQYCIKAGLSPQYDESKGEGLSLLDLGCGWGSLGLYLAERYPNAKVKMLSNSRTQKVHIDGVCKEKGFGNVEVITGDFTKFDFEEKEQFTHILSIEMFEHMKSYPTLFHKLSTWLKPKGKVFIHVFVHKDMPYHFEEGDGWMSKTFFSGGTMPSLDLFTYFQKDLLLLKSWYIPGTHYSQTLETWLRIQDQNKKEALKILEDDAEEKGFGREEGRKSFYRFRVFYMACGEFFNQKNGNEYGVGHYLFEKR